MKYIWDKPTVLILDTNIWLNFLNGSEQEVRTFRKMEELIAANKIILFAPEQVLLEWNRHYTNIIQRTLTTAKNTVDQAKSLLKYFHEPTDNSYHQSLEKIESQIHLNTGIQNSTLCKDIEHLIKNKVTPIKLSNPQLKTILIEFGLQKKKPFGHKNSMGDAVIFFSMYENFSNKFNNNNQCDYDQIYFVTNDVHDFSEGTDDEKRPILHHDLQQLADEIDLKYSDDIHTTINVIKNKKKQTQCVVWDLDNTIWNGDLTKGEFIKLRENTLKTIQSLHNLGIIQSIASKTDYTEGFSKLKQLGIEKYFLLPQLSSNNKSTSIKKIAKLFHIELQKIVFIDNDILELKEVSSELPQVTCINVTDYRGDIYKQLQKIVGFGGKVVVDEKHESSFHFHS
ncbi:HAD-IIIC family phosphatase [Bacillus thuringiensis]|uniref:HAD-IIIC family phosphatase n=1 Tax=Bacillus thuringiensis TaxID=1428 RepID=UPI00339544D3